MQPIAHPLFAFSLSEEQNSVVDVFRPFISSGVQFLGSLAVALFDRTLPEIFGFHDLVCAVTVQA